MSDTAPSIAPYALAEEEGEAIWFLGALLTIKASAEQTDGRVCVIDHVGPPGGSPPHVHKREDEWFYVLDGHITFQVGDAVASAGPGSFVYGPRDVPHSFVIDGDGGARFLLVTEPAGFEGFVRELGTPAASRTLPPPTLALPDPALMIATAATYGMEILGPPPGPANRQNCS